MLRIRGIVMPYAAADGHRGVALRIVGATLCGMGIFLIARDVGWGTDPAWGLYFWLGLLLIAVGSPLWLLGSLLRRRRRPDWDWQPAAYRTPRPARPRMPLWVAAFAIPALVGLSWGLAERALGIRAEHQSEAAWRAAIQAQAREGRPVAAAVKTCVEEVLALRLPNEGPGADTDFARHVATCVLAQPDASHLRFECDPDIYVCWMPVRTARIDPGNLQDSPEYSVDYRDALSRFFADR
jgi:hypothetical protein